MTIKELKEIIKDLPDSMRVGDSGHFGEYLECWEARVTKVKKHRRAFNEDLEDILCISIESAGEEPD